MSLYFVWDATYEALPGNTLPRNLIANEIRTMKLGIRGMMEAQHNFGFNTPADDGSHWGGHVTAALIGTTPGAVTTPQKGSIYINTTTFPSPQIFDGAVWTGGWVLD